MKALTEWFKGFWEDEEGLQTLEIMLIIAVIVVIALLFRERIMTWINDLLDFGDQEIDNFKSE
ncbi:Flp1 family type IVb pilin [Thalassobacillus hwangdonensis]|uniref:Flp1 family type IVb pilin n=1 Tax=Thalassobacillus hwangdonensis TaxID=546108 RepID=A0ABW3KVI9_9BACI